MANIRYDSLQVTEGTYIPEAGKSYPQDDPHARLKPLKRTHEEKIDEHYPYLDDSFHTRWRIFWAYVLILYLSLGTYLYLCMGQDIRYFLFLLLGDDCLEGSLTEIASVPLDSIQSISYLTQ